ncbi:MAG: MarR family transcriptional regulator [Treponema sp.]|nr:MarR family transcriptional regulator [Treponema sp.]
MLLRKLELDGNVSGICEKLQITKPAVTYMLNSFEEDGYITRSIDPADRRRFDIKLTAKGKSLVEKHRNSYEDFFDEVLAKFGSNNTKEFMRLFKRFADVIDEVKEKWGNE